MTKLLAGFYRAFTFILTGIIAGLVLAIKLLPLGDEIKIGKIKVKGKGNKAETVITVDNKTRKEKREEKRKNKKKASAP